MRQRNALPSSFLSLDQTRVHLSLFGRPICRVEREYSSQGSIIIFVALVLPVVLSLLVLASLSLPYYLNERHALQQDIDALNLIATRSLPDTEEAAAVARQLSQFSARLQHNLTIQGTSDSLRLQFSGSIPVLFLGTHLPLPASVHSLATRLPKNVSLLLDVTEAVAPSPASDGWGDVWQWPPSRYLAHYVPPNQLGFTARGLTQQCVNPILAPLKNAAIQVATSLLALPQIPLAIGFLGGGPMSQNSSGAALPYSSFTISRPLISKQYQVQIPSIPSEASLTFPSRAHVTEEICATVAEFDPSEATLSIPSHRFATPARPTIDPATRSFDPQVTTALTTSQAIWFQPARTVSEIDAKQLLNDLSQLHSLGISSPHLNPHDRHESVMLLSGDKVPLLYQLIDAAIAYPRDSRSASQSPPPLTINLIIFAPPEVSLARMAVAAGDIFLLQEKIAYLNSLPHRPRVSLHVVESASDLAQKLIPRLLHQIAPSILAR